MIKGKSQAWLAITPDTNLPAPLDLNQSQVMDTLMNPPDCRYAGWNMAMPARVINRKGDSLKRGSDDDVSVEFFDNGLLEFRAEIGMRFCWPQSEEEFAARPRLSPFAVCEFPVSFLKLYNVLANKLNIPAPFSLAIAYTNISGFRLPPGSPFSPFFDIHTARSEVGKITIDSIGPKYLAVPAIVEPDEIAFRVCTYIYNSFGLEQADIPFYDSTKQRFNFKGPG